MKEAQTAIKAAERTIFCQPTSNDTYTKEIDNIESAYARLDEAWAIFHEFLGTEEEEVLWEQFQSACKIWESDQEEFITMAVELQNIDAQNTVAINTVTEKMKYQTLTVTSESFKASMDI